MLRGASSAGSSSPTTGDCSYTVSARAWQGCTGSGCHGDATSARTALVTQADRLFGARHFRHYEFLLALSENFGGIGLEHHESSENGVKSNYFTEWDKGSVGRDLLALLARHGFVETGRAKGTWHTHIGACDSIYLVLTEEDFRRARR